MAIEAGARVPHAQLTLMDENGPSPIDAAELMAEGTTVLFAVPGAFTPTCSAQHLPGFVQHADELRKRGADRIVCLAVNDANRPGSATPSSWRPTATVISPRRWGWKWTAARSAWGRVASASQ